MDSWSLLSGYTLPTTHFQPLIWSFYDSQILEIVKFRRGFSADTVSDDLHIGAFRVACFGFVDLAQRIYFADNALSTFDLEFLG